MILFKAIPFLNHSVHVPSILPCFPFCNGKIIEQLSPIVRELAPDKRRKLNEIYFIKQLTGVGGAGGEGGGEYKRRLAATRRTTRSKDLLQPLSCGAGESNGIRREATATPPSLPCFSSRSASLFLTGSLVCLLVFAASIANADNNSSDRR